MPLPGRVSGHCVVLVVVGAVVAFDPLTLHFPGPHTLTN